MESEKIIAILAQRFNTAAEEISAQTNLKTDLGADSLDVVELIMAIEDEFNIEIDEQQMPTTVTVGDVVEYVKKARA